MVRQAGSAAALAPVAQRLDAALFAYPSARGGLGDASAHIVRSFADARATLETLDPAFILTGTSLAVEDDGAWWAWARDHGCPGIAHVEQWSNYAERFDGFRTMPAYVAVVDQVAAMRMVRLGCPFERVIVAGTPAYDVLRQAQPDGAAARAACLPADREFLATWICEPVPDAAAFRAVAGYDEAQALDLAAQALGRLDARVHLVLKRHPIQVAAGQVPAAPVVPGLSTGITDQDRLALVAGADLVLGMHSMLLLEAALLGRPVVAVQPGRLRPSDLTDGRPGIQVVVDPALVDGAVRGALARRQAPPRLAPVDHTARFIAALGLDRRHLEPQS
ncbi:hypothetical protein [Zavarzinia sp. CC-PAN008]|uniref:hypothetical protein n=1 Tax=Zavarzinia sp. CC-PAN008 TaxID=3243332 RepID=UPI003F7486E9